MATEEIKTILEDLVRFDSTTRNSTDPIVSHIEQLCEKAGVQSHRLPTATDGKENLLLYKGPHVDDSSGLTLCGHIDTVPANTPAWDSNPWELLELDGNWFARGACDMKGFDAIALNAIFNATDLNSPLAVLLTCDEEIGSHGAKHIKEHGLPFQIPSQMIIGEPTSLQIVRMHKSHISLFLTIEGVTAHTGMPHLGVNSANAAGHVIVALELLANEMQAEHPETSQHFSDGTNFPVLTVATIDCGSAINVVPGQCKLGIGLRLFPHQSVDSEIQRIREVVSQSCSLPWELELAGENPTMFTPDDSMLNEWLSSRLNQSESVGVAFGTDGGYLSQANYDCVLCGPGSIEVAHKPNEYVPIAEVQRCSEIIGDAISHFCKGRS